MAQAARLNLRMQKELKLLLADPPHGASFPFLSPNSDVSSSSLSIIDAQIKGPEGTVYANGFFNIKIQIPERYPFQPPNVTFATPIYHPNIDNGGRICLDILNLPPKGAWQPSLNISSVLRSIGLLLSEPNPDDGLMCEASREYKYNRQAFDQKARFMKEKYAQPGAIGKICGSHLTESPSNSNTMEVETTDNDLKQDVNEYVVSHQKIYKKLSLESLGPSQKRDDYVEGNEASDGLLFLSKSKNHTEVEGTKSQLEDEIHKFNWSREKLSGCRRKLSLEASSRSQKNDGEENVVPNHHLSHTPQDLYVASFGPPPLVPQVGNSYKLELQQCEDNKSVNDNINMRPKKPRGICQDQPLGSLEIINGGKEKMHATTQLLPSETHSNTTEASSRLKALNQIQVQPQNDLMGMNRKKLCLVGKRLSLGFTGSSETQEKDNKENMKPLHTKPLLYSSSSSVDLSTTPTVSETSEDHKRGSGNGVLTESLKKYGTGRKLSLGLQAQFQERNNNDIQPLSHPLSLSTDQSEPVPLHECKEYQKQHSDEDRNDIDTSAGEIKRQETEKTETSEAVIVLDSEDSEEERVVSARSKSLLTRKRFGKWKLRT